MTAVAASPPAFHQPVPRSTWTNVNGASSMHAHAQMTPEEVSRLLMPPRSKSQNAVPSSASSTISSASSTASSTSSSTTATPSKPSASLISQQQQQHHHHQQQQQHHHQLQQQQLPPRPSSSASNSSSISSSSSNGTMPGSNATSTPASSNPSPNNSEPNTPINSAANTVNAGPSWGGAGKRKAARNGVGNRENMKNSGNAASALNAAISNSGTGSFLMLLPLNGTFERKVIPLPFYPEVLRIGRQTNAKTVPTQSNGFFDSKVLSRQHAEVWAEKGTGRVFIRDVKSSNGTFVNGTRLSPENRDSEPHEIRAEDILELGIDIVGEDNKTIVHHKVAARVQHAGFHQVAGGGGNAGNFDLNFGDIDPSVGGGLMAPPLNHVQTVSGVTGRGRSNSQTSRGGPMAFLPNGLVGLQRQGNQMMSGMPITIEAIAKRLNYEMQQARQQQAELKRAHEFFDVVLIKQTKQAEQKEEEAKPLVNGEAPAESSKEDSEAKESSVDDAELPMPLEQIESLTQIKFPSKPPSQILSLVAVLADTKRDLEAKSLRVKELEDSLLRERSARELAEGRIEKLELATLALKAGQSSESPEEAEIVKDELRRLIPDVPDVGDSMDKALTPEPVIVDNEMQLKLDKFMVDFAVAQAEIENLKQSLQKSETEKSSAQKSLSQLAEDKQKEEDARVRAEKALEKAKAEERKYKDREFKPMPNGVHAPAKTGEKKIANGSAGATALATKARATEFQRSYGTPLASFIGAVVVGVAVMAVLNNWTKGDKS
ncbi:hypothetical protein H072_9679 [Dactylellina haptotyla CBS 200.50]|uniref:FHA domain-containing protein n=1 Tax=Dactylellina haptotyla (strain CBS 200.50) TaxID=1284197 RepID=S8BC93_DACHA|nr:hypothetical protein H072_9679 [Dactylellina haptotyla CBS 200.50]